MCVCVPVCVVKIETIRAIHTFAKGIIMKFWHELSTFHGLTDCKFIYVDKVYLRLQGYL